MADLEFNEPQYTAETPEQQPSTIARILINWGLAKDDAGARRALMVILILLVAGIGFLWFKVIL